MTLSRDELSRRGRAGATKRWARIDPVDLATLSVDERRLIMALIAAKKVANDAT